MIDLLILYVLLGMICASIAFVWFNTNAFVEYMRLLYLDSLCKVFEFEQVSEDDPALAYPDFLVANYNNFFTRLISCPKCSMYWISAVVNLLFFIGWTIAIPPSLTLLTIITVCAVPSWLVLSYCSLLLYYKLVRMINT